MLLFVLGLCPPVVLTTVVGLMRFAGKLFGISVEQGATTSIFAASAPELTGRGCEWLDKAAIGKLGSKIAHDPKIQQQMWEFTEKSLGQQFLPEAAAVVVAGPTSA